MPRTTRSGMRPSVGRSGIRESVKEWLLEHGYDIAAERYPRCNYKALWVACENESSDILRQLVEDGVDINSRDSCRNTVLINVCNDVRFDEAKVKRLTESLVMLGANTSLIGSSQARALTIVCRLGYKSVAEYLIQQGVDINHKDRYGRTALSNACERKQRDIIELLLENNVSLDIQDGNADAFFIYACGAGMVDKVLMLLDRGIDCNLEAGKAFYTACENGQTEIVKILLARGLEMEGRSEKFGIDRALSNGHENIIRILLESGVNLNLDTIFRVACLRGCISTCDLLLERGVDINVNVDDADISTGLMNACVGWRVETVKWLIKHGANVNLVSPKTGMNALMYSCSCMEGDIAKILIDNGIDIHTTDKHKRTALIHACNKGSYEIVKILIEKGVSLNGQSVGGMTALMWACQYHFRRNSVADDSFPEFGVDESSYLKYSRKQNIGKARAIQLLIERGADIDLKDDNGAPAIFHIMGNHLNYKCMQTLIDAGANLDYFEEKGLAILPWVLENRRLRNCLSILMNTGVFTDNGRLKPKYRFVWAFAAEAHIDCLKEMMNLGLFEWDMCECNNLPVVLPVAMESGICPGKVVGPSGVSVSPLIYSFQLHDRDLLKLIFNSGYFYPEDYRILCSDQSEELSEFLYDITHNPMSLFKWSFINVSKAISLGGSPSTRKQRVDALDIPELFKNGLKFFTTFAA